MAERLFSWVTPIPRCEPALNGVRRALATIAADPAGNTLLPFGKLPMLHFASLTLFDEDAGHTEKTLVFESNIDGLVGAYLIELARVGRAGLDQLYSACDDYPGVGATDAELVEYLGRCKKSAQLYHVGHPNRSLQAIRGDLELRRSIERELDVDKKLRDRSPAEIVATLRARANCPHPLLPLRRPWHPTWANPPILEPTPLREIRWKRDALALRRAVRWFFLGLIGWVLEVALVVALGYFPGVPRQATLLLTSAVIAGLVHMSSPDNRLLRGVLSALLVAIAAELFFWVPPPFDPARPPMLLAIASVLVLAPFAVIAVSYVNIAVRLKVTKPLPVLDGRTRQAFETLVDAEDRPENSIYNHVAGLSIIKQRFRFFRRIRTRLALSFLNLFYRTYFVKGKLVSIPSIHFAQWTLVDDRRLLFLTNYDGSADSYLDDFFNSLAEGVAFIWYDTELFPSTTDPRLLKIWVRAGQTLASVRYRAPVYESLTVGLINNNTFIRTRLLRGRGQGSARRWLRRFATTPVEPTRLVRLTIWLKELSGLAE